MKSSNSPYSALKYLLPILLMVFVQTKVLASRYPDAITSFSGGTSYCQGDAANALTVIFSTCRSGNPRSTKITITWYSNNTNSTSGGTQVAQTSSTTSTTTFTYTPSTGTVGTLYYYVEITWASGSCNNPSPLSTSTFSTSTLEVIVDPPTPAQAGAISGSTTVSASTSGLVYSISAVTDATSYTWTVPSGWTIDSGQGTTSINTTSGTTGGDITVTADNSCGSSTPQTLSVTVASNDCPESTSVTPTGIQTLCQGDASSQLTAAITTSGGSGTPTPLYQWYYNTTNSNTVSGATLLAGATNATYSPLTTASEVGDRWYFCVGYSTDNGCGQTNADQTLASNAVKFTVIAAPAVPGTISGADFVNPSTSGLSYSISAVPTATSYTWTVPSGWAINSGQGTISISVTSGTLGQDGDITVSASNSCGTSAASTLAVTVTTATFPPTITLGANPSVCQGTTSADLEYSATTESPDQYSIDYFAESETAGFIDVVNATLPASPIVLVVPGGSATGTYYGNLTVRNSGSGLSSGNYTISVSVMTTPATPGLIFGSTSQPEITTGLQYAIIAVEFATTYTWTVPTGWSITDGQGTSGIVVTSGTAGQNGNITVTAGNTCGTSAASTLAVVSETPADHSLYGCNACHITHNSPGGSLTSTLGNANLCLSCHVSSGAASGKPFTNADKAIPGTGGTSHSWDVASVNTTYETVLTSDPQMVLRIDNGNITCSVCHDQHNSNANLNYTRVSNSGDAMCKDCHSPRNVGRYVDNTSLNKGSHPVGLSYTGTGDFEATPTGSVTLPGGNIECSSCHQTHYSTTTDGNLLRQTNDDVLCTSCHTLGTHNGMNCSDCHQTHNTKSNIYMIKNTITTPNSGDKTVVFAALTGTNSFADGDATYDGICEVCHTTTQHYQNDGTSADQSHTSSGGPMDSQNCTSCHPHNADFSPPCRDCHTIAFPGWGNTDAHYAHTDKYNYSCTTCHLDYGFGGSLEGTHPNSTLNPDNTMNTLVPANVNFDPNGLATRNGQDGNTPGWNGTNCSNIYCHSNGRSAYRGTDGTYTWSGTTGSQTATYASPAWSGSITTCNSCHSGTGNMTDPYTITTPGLADPLPPATGSHRRGAHESNSQENAGNGWTAVNCFWCHNASAGDDGSPILQGTYGTSFHVDGQTYFDPRSFVDGGTILNNPSGGSFSYSYNNNSGHCGDGKTCW